MKKIIFLLPGCLWLQIARAQQQQGKVVYERTMQLKVMLQGVGEEVAQMMPTSRKDKIEVLFGKGQALQRAVNEEDAQADMADAESGMHVKFVMAGNDEQTFSSFKDSRTVKQMELGGKQYLLTDSIHKMNWKITGETTTILNYPCQQAVAQHIGKRIATTMKDGEMKTTEVADTSNMVAWFTMQIPVPAGPELQGQLPGLILGLDMGTLTYRAVSLSPDVDLAELKEPTKGKRITTEEFNKERDKMFKEIQQRTSGRATTIKIGQ